MPGGLLKWQRTDLPRPPREGYTGLDPAWPRLYARIVYFASNFNTATPWYWLLAETVTIAAGYEATIDAAVHAAERAYAAWRDSKSAT